MEINGNARNGSAALKKRKATGTTARGKAADNGDDEVPVTVSTVKKARRTSNAREESEFVSVEIGMRELHKRIASSKDTIPTKRPKKTTQKEDEASVSTSAKRVTKGSAKKAAAADADEVPTVKKPPAKRKAAGTTKTATANGTKAPTPTPRKRATTPTKPKSAAAKSKAGLAAEPKPNALAQARAEAMQQQQQRIQQRVDRLQPSVAHGQASEANAAPQGAPVAAPPPPYALPHVPTQTGTTTTIERTLPSQEDDRTESSQGFIEEDIDEDLAFLQALEEVERGLHQTPSQPAEPPKVMSPLPSPNPPAGAPAKPIEKVEVITTPSPVVSTPAIPPEMLAEYERLKRENDDLRRSNELLQAEKSTSVLVSAAAPLGSLGSSSSVITTVSSSPRLIPQVPAITDISVDSSPSRRSPPAVLLPIDIEVPLPGGRGEMAIKAELDHSPIREMKMRDPAEPIAESDIRDVREAVSVDVMSPPQTKPFEPVDGVPVCHELEQPTSVVSTKDDTETMDQAEDEVNDDAAYEEDEDPRSDGEGVREGEDDVSMAGEEDDERDDDEEEDDEEEDGEDEDDGASVESHVSTIDRGNYRQYKTKSDDDDDDDDDDEEAVVIHRARNSQASHMRRQVFKRPPPSQASPQAITSAAAATGSDTESDTEQHKDQSLSSSSSDEDDEEEEEEGTAASKSNVLDAALRAATGRQPLTPAKKKKKKSVPTAQDQEMVQVKEEAAAHVMAKEEPYTPPQKATKLKKKRTTTLTTTSSSAKDKKSTLLWPTLDDLYDFVLDLTPRRVPHSDPAHLQLLRGYEKERRRLPSQYPGLSHYCDVQLEAILQELLASVRNSEEMSLYNSTRTKLWLTSISPCSSTSSTSNSLSTSAAKAASLAATASSSLNSNVIFMESGFSGTSANGKNDFIVTFQDNQKQSSSSSSSSSKNPLDNFVSGDLVVLRSPQWRDADVHVFGIVLCSSMVAVDGASSSSSSATSNNSNSSDQLCILLRAPSASEDSPDAGSHFCTVMEMCLVNQRSSQWCWSLEQVHNLTTTAREYQAMKSVRFFKPETKEMLMSGIIPEIVKSEQTQIVEPRKKLTSGLYDVLESKYNSSQLQAILGSISDDCAISIIQGPPGTGKTKTILGVLSALLDGAALSASRQAQAKSRIRIGASLQQQTSSTSKSTAKQSQSQGTQSTQSSGGAHTSVAQNSIRILVAAPSNAAVDELIVRLIADGVYDARAGKSYRPRLVRVGRPEALQQTSSSSSSSQRQQQDGLTRKKKWRKYASEVEEILLESLVSKHRSAFATAKQARQTIIQNAQIVFCTLSGAGSVAMCELQSQHFDALVIDEAAQAVEASLLIPFKFQPGRIVLVGDHRQLPATVISKRLIDLGYDRSLFQRLVETGSRVFLLEQQYRMHPEISWFPSTFFYHGKLVEAPQMKEWTARKYHQDKLFRPFVFFDVLSGQQSQVTGSKSLRNLNEIECILVLLTRLAVEQFPELEWKRKIGIIAPYKQQIHEIRNELQRWEQKYDKRMEIEVNTVDGFQGREKEIIIYSCVRTGRGGSRNNRNNGGQPIEAFWADERRMNVAITRAKSSLWIIGNSTLLQQSTAWRALIQHAKDSRRYVVEADMPQRRNDRDDTTTRRESDSRDRARDRSRDRSRDRR